VIAEIIAWLTIAVVLVLPGLMVTILGSDCTIYSSDFSSDDLATNWTQTAGSWSIGSGVLTTGSAGAILELTGVTHPNFQIGRFRFKAKCDTSGGKVRVGFGYGASYGFMELTFNGASSTLKLWQHSGGSDTQIDITKTINTSLNTYYILQYGWTRDDAHEGWVLFDASDSPIAGFCHNVTNSSGAPFIGASPNGGTATFDDALWRHDRNEGGLTCDSSTDGCEIDCLTLSQGAIATSAIPVTVTISGNTSSCATALNTAHATTVGRNTAGTQQPTDGWCFDTNGGPVLTNCPNPFSGFLNIRMGGLIDGSIAVNVRAFNGFSAVVFEASGTISGPVDCAGTTSPVTLTTTTGDGTATFQIG